MALQSFTKRVIPPRTGTVSCFTFVYSFCTRIHSSRKVQELVEETTLPERTSGFFKLYSPIKKTHYYGVQDYRGLKRHSVGK